MPNHQNRQHNRARGRVGRACLASLIWASVFTSAIATSHAEPRTIEQTHAGRTLLANLAHADGQSRKTPIVLMVHGTFGHKDMEIMTALQPALSEREVHSLAITLSLGTDRRMGPRDCNLPIRDTYADSRDEISVWLNWLTGEGYENIVLFGHSRGGARVAEFLSLRGKIPDVNGAILLAPATEKPGRLVREFRGSFSTDEMSSLISRIKAADRDEMFDLPGFLYCSKATASTAALMSYYGPDQVRDTPTLLKGMTHTNVLVIAAGADTVIKGLPEKMKSLAGVQNISFKVVDDADHLFHDFYAEDAADIVAAFAKASVGN